MSRRASPTPSRPGARPAPPPARPADGAAPSPVFPPLRELADPRAPYLFPLLLLLLSRWWFSHELPFASEDAYITFRYAMNLAGGLGAVFNPDERVMGYTSAPWMLWNAAGHVVMKDPVLWSRIWTTLGDVVTLLVMGALLSRSASRASAWCFTTFFAAWTFFGAVAMSGMENSLMLTLIALGASLAVRGSPAAGPVLALLALWRPEGVASAAVIALGARWRDRAIAIGLAVAGLGALALYYGSPVPQSLLAKSQIYGTAGPWQGRHWWEWILPFILGRYPTASEANLMIPLTVLLAPALVAGAPVAWRERRSAMSLALAGALVVWLGYAALGVAYFFWYMVVPLAGIVALAAVGLPRIVRGPGIYVSCALLIAGTWTLTPILYRGRALAEHEAFGSVARYLFANANSDETVMLEPIGIIGYHAPVRVIDEVGLVSPAVAARRVQGPGWYADIVEQKRPEWLAVRQPFLKSGEAWAGAGAPFRSAAERDSVLARYVVVPDLGPRAKASLVLLRRVR